MVQTTLDVVVMVVHHHLDHIVVPRVDMVVIVVNNMLEVSAAMDLGAL